MVEIYRGGYSLVSGSGIGQAIVHQEKILHSMNIGTNGKYQNTDDIVHINTVLPDSVIEAIRAKKRGAKVIWFAHSTEEDFRNSFSGTNIVSPLFRRWIMYCYSMGDVIITPTEYSRNLLLGYGIDRPIYVLSNGVDTEYFVPDRSAGKRYRRQLNLPADSKVVISVGHLIERKGILDFIKAAEKMPDVTFVWYGDTPRQFIRNNVRRAMMNAPKNVRFAGRVPQSELRLAYQGADAFLFMSLEETEGIVVLEALSCKIPVIVRDIPVYKSWLADGESAYKVNGTDDAVHCLEEVLSHPNDKVQSAGRAVAESRSYKLSGERLLDIYESEGLCEMIVNR